jgi:hypothetical protein
VVGKSPDQSRLLNQQLREFCGIANGSWAELAHHRHIKSGLALRNSLRSVKSVDPTAFRSFSEFVSRHLKRNENGVVMLKLSALSRMSAEGDRGGIPSKSPFGT